MVRRTWWIAGLMLALGCAAPENPEARYENTVRARACFESGDLKRAQALLNDLADDSRDPAAWSNVGLVLWRRGKQAGAERAWRTALQFDGQCARAYYGLGLAAQTRGREARQEAQSNDSEKKRAAADRSLADAVQALQAAAAADPSSPAVQAALAAALTDAGRDAEAEKARTELAHLDPAGVLAASEAAEWSNVQLPPRPRAAATGAIPVRFRREALAARAGGVMVCDLDGNGRPDLLLGGHGVSLRADSVQGAVHFSPQPFLPGVTARMAVSLLADRDATPDVIVVAVPEVAAAVPASAPAGGKQGTGPGRSGAERSGTPAANSCSVWLLRGGSSAPQLLAEVPADVRALRAADIDRDGDTDLIAATNAVPGLRVWRNDGDGGFDFEPAIRGLENTPPLRGVACGDFTGDQRADLVAADAAGRLRVLAQAADGSFCDVSRVANLNLERTRVLEAADVDADGTLDLLLGNDAGLWVLANRGNARFVRTAAYRVAQTRWSGESPPRVPVVAILRLDFDNDGFEDVVTLHPTQSSPSPAVVAALPASNGLAAAAAAVEDAAPELPAPVLATPCAAAVWRNTGRGYFVGDDGVGADTVDLLSAAVAVADFDADGDLDFAGAGPDSTVAVYWNEGGNKNRRLRVELSGERGLQDGLGAALEIHSGPRTLVTAAALQPVWVGVATDTRLDVVRVVWPDGTVQSLLDVDLPSSGALRIERRAAR